METRSRRARNFAARETLFLRAAEKQICDAGLLSLQMAKVAKDCQYATGTLYQHFKSKEDLLLALCADQTLQRAELFHRVESWQAPSRLRMMALTMADALLIQHHPDHFRLAQYCFTEVVWGAASQERRDALLEVHRPMAELVSGVVQQGRDDGDLGQVPLPNLHVGLGQLALHVGFSNLVHAHGTTEYFQIPNPERLCLQHAALHLNALGWQPLLDAFDLTALQAQLDHICTTLFGDLCPDQDGQSDAIEKEE